MQVKQRRLLTLMPTIKIPWFKWFNIRWVAMVSILCIQQFNHCMRCVESHHDNNYCIYVPLNIFYTEILMYSGRSTSKCKVSA